MKMMDKVLSGFAVYLQNGKSVSKSTYQSYVRDIYGFTSYLESSGVSPASASVKTIKNYISELDDHGKSNATILRIAASIRCFYRYLLSINEIKISPAEKIRIKQDKKELPQVLSNNEIDRLLAQPSNDDLKGLRDKAMLELLYATGIRVSELVALNIGDVILDAGMLYCHSDEKNSRIIPVYPDAVEAVRKYLAAANFVPGDKSSPLFINLNGNRLTRQGFWKIIKQYAGQADIDKKITPHTLRHSFAAHMIENGADIKIIQQMLGHADISSTLVYVRMIKNRSVEVYNKCHPRA